MLVSDDAPFCAQVTGVDCGCVERALTDRTQVGVFCVRRVTIDMVVGGVSTPKVGVFPALSECTELLCFVNESSGVYPNFCASSSRVSATTKYPDSIIFFGVIRGRANPKG